MEKAGLLLVKGVIIYFFLSLGSLYFLNWYIGEPEMDLSIVEADSETWEEFPARTLTPQPSEAVFKEGATPTPKADTIAQELAKHNTPSDCWMTLDGHLYNITPYFGSHPGGNAVMLPYCGKDATAAFNSKNASPARAHSGTAKQLLLRYLIQ